MAQLRPNIIVIMADQLKATALRMYSEYGIETPNIERLAAQGVCFRNAFTPHPLCVPARISLWTGRYPHAHGGRRNETFMPPDEEHAFKRWKANGYFTALIGKNHCFTPEDLCYFDEWSEITHRGILPNAMSKGPGWFRPAEAVHAAHEARRSFGAQLGKPKGYVTNFHLDDYSSGLIAGQTERFLAAHADKPFALWVSFPDPHEPYEVPEHFFAMVPEDIKLPPWNAEALATSPERMRILDRILAVDEGDLDALRHTLRVYLAMTLFIDHSVGRILDALEAAGQADNTIVVFCADHGDFGGERRMFVKGGVFQDCLTHVPLIVSCPGTIPAGRQCDAMVNLVDILPTLYSLQGSPIGPEIQGQPLPQVTDTEPRTATFSEYGAGGPPYTMADLDGLNAPMGYKALFPSLRWREAEGRRKMVRTAEWKYVHDPMGDIDELYDMTTDPWELKNLAADPAHAATVAELQRILLGWSVMTEDGKPVPLPSVGPGPAAS